MPSVFQSNWAPQIMPATTFILPNNFNNFNLNAMGPPPPPPPQMMQQPPPPPPQMMQQMQPQQQQQYQNNPNMGMSIN
jgi:hypothetical protein